MQPTRSENASGLSFSSTPVTLPRGGRAPFSAPRGDPPFFEKSISTPTHYPEELRALLDEAGVVRGRILTNRVLEYWFVCMEWILGAFILAALFSRYLISALIIAAVCSVAGAVGSWQLAKRKGPSIYAAACQLDATAGLQDRLSTTIYFAATEDPGWLILQQRRDALARLKSVNARALFPFQMPAAVRRTAAIAVVAAGLISYRIEYGPPAVALVHKVAQTHLATAAISPLLRAVENVPLNLLDRRKPDVLDEEAAAAGMPTHEEKAAPVFPFGEPNANNSNSPGPQNTPSLFPTDSKGNDRTTQSQGQMQSQGTSSQNAEQNHDQTGANPNSQKSASDGKNPSANQGQQSDGGTPKSGQQSLGQKLVSALKQMMGNMSGQDSNQTPSQPPPDTQGPSAQGQGGQSSTAEGKGGQQASLTDAKAKEISAKSGAHSGAGNGTQQQAAQKQAPPDAAQQQSGSNMVPERVQLDASDFRVQTHPRAMPGPGTAQVPLTNASVTGAATTNGAEQQDIPLRYRQYVQRYFDQGQK